jgi:hypothetical protein
VRRCSNAGNFKTTPLNTNPSGKFFENFIYYLIQLHSIKTNKNPDPIFRIEIYVLTGSKHHLRIMIGLAPKRKQMR